MNDYKLPVFDCPLTAMCDQSDVEFWTNYAKSKGCDIQEMLRFALADSRRKFEAAEAKIKKDRADAEQAKAEKPKITGCKDVIASLRLIERFDEEDGRKIERPVFDTVSAMKARRKSRTSLTGDLRKAQ
jgi:hypothetical protein